MNRKRVQREELLWEKSELVLEYRDEEGQLPMLEPRWAKECWRNQKQRADQKVTAKPLPDWQGSVRDEPFHWKGSQPYGWIFSAISPRKNNVHFISILVSTDGTYHLGINLRLIFCLAKIQEIQTQKKSQGMVVAKGPSLNHLQGELERVLFFFSFVLTSPLTLFRIQKGWLEKAHLSQCFLF